MRREGRTLSLFIIGNKPEMKSMSLDQDAITGSGGVLLYADDTLEDLQRAGYRLIQKARGFRFGMDSVLLAAYAASFYARSSGRRMRVVDLGAGCGAVSLLLAARLTGARVTGIEIDPDSCETMQRNIRLNRLENRMTAIFGDIRLLAAGQAGSMDLSPGSFDLAVSNPPYEVFQPARTSGSLPERSSRRRAREETDLSLDDLVRAAARLLRSGGRLVMVHQVRRLPDIICALHSHGLAAQTMRLIETLPGKPPVTFLLSAVRQGRPGGFVAGPALHIRDRDGNLSDEITQMYGLDLPLSRSQLMDGLQPMATTPAGGEGDQL